MRGPAEPSAKGRKLWQNGPAESLVNGGKPMASDSDTTSAGKRTLIKIAIAVEVTIAVLLGFLGLRHILMVKEPESWTGFALIGLALLFYMMRGQVITKLSVGTDGVAWEMAQQAIDKAERAQKDAAIAKGVATQYVVPASAALSGASASADAAAEPANEPEEGKPTNPWSHPKLKRGNKPDNDPQKNQWGGLDTRNGRRLSARVETVDEDWFKVVLRVDAVSGAPPISGLVRFHLHDTFGESAVPVTPVGGVAEIERFAYGAFTVGAEVENELDTYLELDLAQLPNAPPRFKER